MQLTPESKAIIHWLNSYAFVAWSLMNYGDLGLDALIEMSENDTDEYKKMLKEFNEAKLAVIEEASEVIGGREDV